MLVKIEDTVYKVSWKHTMPNEEGNGCTIMYLIRIGGLPCLLH